MRGVGKLSALRLSPVNTSSHSFWIFVERHRLSSVTNQLMWENCFGCDSGLEGKEAASNTKLLLQLTQFTGSIRAPPPPPLLDSLGAFCVFITPVPRLINDTANVTSNHKTLCAGDNYASARRDKLCILRPGGEKKSDYVIDIYLDRMKVL